VRLDVVPHVIGVDMFKLVFARLHEVT
jgi:hypothetical protein